MYAIGVFAEMCEVLLVIKKEGLQGCVLSWDTPVPRACVGHFQLWGRRVVPESSRFRAAERWPLIVHSCGLPI